MDHVPQVGEEWRYTYCESPQWCCGGRGVVTKVHESGPVELTTPRGETHLFNPADFGVRSECLSQRSTTCVVQLINQDSKPCGKPVVGERADYPMCQHHYDVFAPLPADEP